MFLTGVISYIVGIFLSITLFKSLLFILTIFFIALCLITFYLIKKFNNDLTYYLIPLIFFLLGMININIFNLLNKNSTLTQDTNFISLYGEVYDIQNSSYENKAHVFLTNLISKDLKDLPNNIRLSYRYDDLKIGDIVKINSMLFSTNSKIHPQGLNLGYTSIAKNIGAYGFILGKADVIINDKAHGIYDKFLDNIQAFKKKLIDKIKSYNLKNSGLLIALTLGESDSIPKEDLQNLQLSSLAHLISISGYHIGIIAGFIFFTFRFGLALIPNLALRINLKKLSALATILVLIFYLLLLEFPIPATRATIMIIAFMISILLDFKAFSLNSLFLAVFIILTLNPYYIFSAGFLLSSIATLTIILFVHNQLIKKINDYKYNYNIIIRTFIVIILSMILTLFVEITIAPILAFYFGYIPTMGIISNVLASPLFSFIIMPSMIIYFITPSIVGIYFIKFADFTIDYLLAIANFVAHQKYNYITTSFFPDYILVYFIFSYLIILLINNKYILSIVFFTYIIILGNYFITFKYPDILIDASFNTIAINVDGIYELSSQSNKFLLNNWFNNKIPFSYNLYSNKNCTENHCLFNIKNKRIIIANNSKLLSEDCGNADLIILQHKAPFLCDKINIIDEDFIKKHYTTFIHINNKIEIKTAQ
jgi:competence protein ComEC